jgi:hypothetical protein
VSSLPLQFSEAGFPVTWGPVETILGLSATKAIAGPTDGRCMVVQGIDSYATGPLGTVLTSWYDLNGVGPVFFSSEDMDPAAVHGYTQAWRGSIGLTAGDTLTVKVSTLGLATLAIMAWGIVVPITLAGHF